ncbi:sigma-54-dependent transcriptional regulator [Nitratidesulfovibrio sp. SRB-5]|uniref:sigma-54-dependent transcriptional regulator n=1 Tax=Nitratidesulfovibrio sp. SRB-5 TaxID=2872636 RepID=UPI00102841AA|nr:sigma-54 dependent transcriptional regulator [Nitratidesulfovibrio sp. SRB-5]MBZ2171016.1 sigma-54 dependent transcriptional regulator [Nitratidesulfovibrio sp. SRB-5]RXF77032.1 sigma-54-dependent Fis family transcriptional regulator [Desulfovibrio sp. DS-1]
MANVLIIDDDELFCEMLRSAMEMEGHASSAAHSLADGARLLERDVFDAVFLDVRLPDGNGLDMLPRLRHMASPPEIIIVTAAGDPDGAELAITDGAWDYVEKPASLEQMRFTLDRALRHRNRQTRQLRRPLDTGGIVGASQRLAACLERLAEAAMGDAAVLVTGETGTGKELFARALHRNSRRASGPFITLDCAALSRSLLHSELFGYQRGAFTGAMESRAGLIRQAHGGTLFLDEVGELPLAQQKAFLRVLQERRFRPIGSKEEVESDFRLVAATNRNLPDMAERGTFRKDLLFRLQAVELQLPPLRERKEDIRELVATHAERICRRDGIGAKGFEPDVYEALAAHDWPGNVRELVNVVEGALLLAHEEPVVQLEHLPVPLRARMVRHRLAPGAGANATGAASAAAAALAGNAGQGGQWGPGGFAPGKPCMAYPAAPDGGLPPDICPGIAGGIQGLPCPAEFPPGLQPSCGAPGQHHTHPRVWRDYRNAALGSVEKGYLHHLLLASEGNITKAARMAGLSRQRLYALLRKHGVMRQWVDDDLSSKK